MLMIMAHNIHIRNYICKLKGAALLGIERVRTHPLLYMQMALWCVVKFKSFYVFLHMSGVRYRRPNGWTEFNIMYNFFPNCYFFCSGVHDVQYAGGSNTPRPLLPLLLHLCPAPPSPQGRGGWGPPWIRARLYWAGGRRRVSS